MDFNFHYCTVKVLARKAGFSEEDSQLLASYSQFVDDFDTYRDLHFTEVPEYARHLATEGPLYYTFHPVTTGFNSLLLDYPRLLTLENQKKITVPFHFIPFNSLATIPRTDRARYRTQPSYIGDSSMISDLMIQARNYYLASGQTRKYKICIGLLLHIFADTYAHQYFSGFSGWENEAKLSLCINNENEVNITSSQIPAVSFPLGHASILHAPDLTCARFNVELKMSANSTEPLDYQRSNTYDFCQAARNILDYLLSLQKRDPISTDDWRAMIPRLTQGFFTGLESNRKKLMEHWFTLYPDIGFHYDKNDMYYDFFSVPEDVCRGTGMSETEVIDQIIQNPVAKETDAPILLSAKNEAFFQYNVLAHSVRYRVNYGFRVAGGSKDIGAVL
ncbi:DUF6765 family protein [Clostridium sp. AM58-1XD]|uniref:DUF6765 family protein n=1 Tax=Clostridium sp. AM58-1XD TaxID=2292307 RepID=UPI000E556F06|nr:DUF6765 family protein [Clostridium sp. AM58-1XD]RGY98602.1 hypothetical protein DXA13_11025 [Clostridium sp. AM58-1XD]